MSRRVVVGNRRRGGAWWRLPLVLTTWSLLVVPVVGVAIAWTTLRRWARELPAVPDLEAWTDDAPRTSRMLAADGSVMAELPFRDGKAVGYRSIVHYDELPPLLIHAILAAEDVRFFEHEGVDPQAVVRAALANYRAGTVVEGASTITQQVARNLLPEAIGTERSLRRKVREALLALRLEQRWSKQEILTVYANFVFLGANAYGVRAAARAYFDRDLDQLTAAQAATIAGLAQAPGRASPLRDPAAAKARRDEVLERMGRAGFLDDAAVAAARAEPLGLHDPGVAYGAVAPWYTEHVRQLLEDGMAEELDLGGLEIDTAAQPVLAVEAQRAAVAHTDGLDHGHGDGPPEVAAILWDHHSGYIEALVGGRAWGPDDQFDRVLQGCRQPGSAWKPIVYGAALEAGAITPGTPLRDAPIAEYDEATGVHWKPRSGHGFRGVALAQDALASSLNAPAIAVLDSVGATAVIAFARRLGITTAIADVRPMALGASCVKPIELARAYAVFARRGWAVAPRFVVRVRRGDDVIFDAAVPEDPWLAPARRLDRLAALAGVDPDVRTGLPPSDAPLVDARVAFQLDDMLAAVIARGTATSARRLGRPAAGKTGTTNDNTDAWFVGFTGRELAAVWVGHDTPADMGGRDDGAHAAVPLWVTLMRLAEGDRAPVPVPGAPPPGMTRVRIDRETGLLSARGAGGGLDLWFRAGTEPTEEAGAPTGTSDDFGRASRQF
ncbi:MAG: transglycosylase domain-containing protein [Myxococcales bacterium]|nr:transglycosylase domain-containing protein [Myxococcales bacterium]